MGIKRIYIQLVLKIIPKARKVPHSKQALLGQSLVLMVPFENRKGHGTPCSGPIQLTST